MDSTTATTLQLAKKTTSPLRMLRILTTPCSTTGEDFVFALGERRKPSAYLGFSTRVGREGDQNGFACGVIKAYVFGLIQ